jgi:hypothetical protein
MKILWKNNNKSHFNIRRNWNNFNNQEISVLVKWNNILKNMINIKKLKCNKSNNYSNNLKLLLINLNTLVCFYSLSSNRKKNKRKCNKKKNKWWELVFKNV